VTSLDNFLKRRPWRGHRRAIDLLRHLHEGTWSYDAKAHACYVHHESGRRVYCAIPTEGHGDDVQLYWADTKERADCD